MMKKGRYTKRLSQLVLSHQQPEQKSGCLKKEKKGSYPAGGPQKNATNDEYLDVGQRLLKERLGTRRKVGSLLGRFHVTSHKSGARRKRNGTEGGKRQQR
ncbi:hypothetical protein H0G86_004935 [Trichoderma simmonsii]|uniref:Uncharacterized protein n=1 Tax=Trichoderma simmonsii TaxID=1491479 RepID=A0A8G0LDJ8_9HYPO|nr:hypothetical protein H0G86_004935 [Trichoderma simmonsii]